MSNKKLLADSFLISSGRMLSRFLGLISTFIVARLLLPEDYAVIATAMIVQDLALRLQDVGFNQNLISSKDQSAKFVSTVFWTRTLVSFILSLLLFIFAPQFAELLNSPPSEAVIRVICWCIFLGSTVNVNVVLAMRQGDFMPEFKINVSSKIISVIATILLAYYLDNYWALAIGMLLSSLLTFAFGYMVCKNYPLIRPSFKMMGEVFGYSKWYLLLQFVDFTVSKLFIFSIGKYIGEKMLGAYSLMNSVGFMYSLEIAAAFDKANLTHLVRSLSLVNPGEEAYKEIYKNVDYVFKARDIFIIPVYMYSFFHSELVVSLLFGNKWIFASDMLSLISLVAIATSYSAIFSTVFNALRKPSYILILNILRFVGMLISAYLGVRANSAITMLVGSLVTELVALSCVLFVSIRVAGFYSIKTLGHSLLTFFYFFSFGIFSSVIESEFISSALYVGFFALFLVAKLLLKDPVFMDTKSFFLRKL